jgi:hypothetical protein
VVLLVKVHGGGLAISPSGFWRGTMFWWGSVKASFQHMRGTFQIQTMTFAKDEIPMDPIKFQIMETE